jgi:hypothetical protein
MAAPVATAFRTWRSWRSALRSRWSPNIRRRNRDCRSASENLIALIQSGEQQVPLHRIVVGLLMGVGIGVVLEKSRVRSFYASGTNRNSTRLRQLIQIKSIAPHLSYSLAGGPRSYPLSPPNRTATRTWAHSAVSFRMKRRSKSEVTFVASLAKTARAGPRCVKKFYAPNISMQPRIVHSSPPAPHSALTMSCDVLAEEAVGGPQARTGLEASLS